MSQSSDIEAPIIHRVDDIIEISTIPIENRISHLAMNKEPLNLYLNASIISKLIGTNPKWISETATKLGIETIKNDEIESRNSSELYPVYTFELLENELHWQRDYKKLDTFISSRMIAEFIGRSNSWTRKTLLELEIVPKTSRKFPNYLSYHKKTVNTFRELILETPLSDGWHTLRELEATTGQEYEWINNRFIEAGVSSERRRSISTGRLHNFYPAESLDIINESVLQRPSAGGEWLTERGICLATGMSKIWVSKRIAERYSDLAELRLDDQKNNRLHYPPNVIEYLVIEANTIRDCPTIGEFLSKNDISRKVGHGVLWVTEGLEVIGATPEQRRNSKNVVRNYYHPDIIDKLLELPTKI
ncbi:MAG: hypothetical protein WCK26_04080 [Candidatus Saccharibacteria bacterium]